MSSGPLIWRALSPGSSSAFKGTVWAGLVAAIYVGAAQVGLSLSVAHGNATPVWAPTGIAIAALVLFGRRLWPGVLLGAFIANALTPVPWWTSFLIACGNTLEAVVAATLLGRMNLDPGLRRTRDVFAFVGAGGALSPVVSATIGVTALVIAGQIGVGDYWFHWGIWWVGDAMGALLVAPLLLTWAATRWDRLDASRLIEAIVVVTALVTVGTVVFSREPPAASFLVFPLIVWATLRFGQRGATASVVIAATFGVTAILSGARPFGGATATESVALLQALLSLVAISMLVVAATISERERADVALQEEAARAARREEQLREMEEGHARAVELNDEVVQGLAVAKLALELGHVDDAHDAIDGTLDSARRIVTDLLSRNGHSEAGGFRRVTPARSQDRD